MPKIKKFGPVEIQFAWSSWTFGIWWMKRRQLGDRVFGLDLGPLAVTVQRTLPPAARRSRVTV